MLANGITEAYRQEAVAWRLHYRTYFKHAARALGIGFIMGFLYFMFRPGQEEKAMGVVMKALKDIPMEGSPLIQAAMLFYHNSRASVVAMTAGLVPFLFLPILDPLINGAVLGLLLSMAKHQGMDVPRLILTQILPHGIFEFAAILYSASLGLYLSAQVGKSVQAFRRAWRKRNEEAVANGAVGAQAAEEQIAPAVTTSGSDARTEQAEEAFSIRRETPVLNALRSFILIVLPLFLVAAFIEAYITPLLY